MTEENKDGITRRSVARGIAWATPVVAMAAVVPQAVASPRPCVPFITLTDASYKCCANGPKKGMHLELIIQLPQECEPEDFDGLLWVRNLRLGNNVGQILPTTWIGATDNGDGTRTVFQGITVTANVYGVQSCPHYLDLEISSDAGVTYQNVQFSTDNVSGGNLDTCAAFQA